MTSRVHMFLTVAVSVVAVVLAGCPLEPGVGPAAAFSATPRAGDPPLTVQFTDSSSAGSASITSWAWDFGDGATTAERTPSHTYTSAGSYTVALTVTTSVGVDKETKMAYIVVSLGSEGEGEGEGEGEPIPGEMVVIPACTFAMGDPWGEGSSDERPVHDVTLSAYQIGKYEVTNHEYADVLNWGNAEGYLDVASHSTADAYGVQLLDVDDSDCQITWNGSQFVVDTRDTYSMADHPVVEVAWYGAVVYCNWLSESNGLQPCYDTGDWSVDLSRNGYHLPTEAQWERAAAWSTAGDGYHYRYGNGSDSISCASANYYNGSYCCNPLGLSSYPYTSPVGYYTGVSSPAGCYDMSGNVWEWCNDWWYRVYTEDSVTDPEGPSTGTFRLVRGGSWGGHDGDCRSANRRNADPDSTNNALGFRVVCTP